MTECQKLIGWRLRHPTTKYLGKTQNSVEFLDETGTNLRTPHKGPFTESPLSPFFNVEACNPRSLSGMRNLSFNIEIGGEGDVLGPIS